MQDEKTIGTHSGNFHTDEVLGCVMLTKYTKEFQGAQITRTRNLEELKKFDLILDVGGEYDPATYRFDHHQREFNEHFSADYDVKLSSAGLIYKHFGREIVRNISEHLLRQYNVKLDLNEENLELIYQRLYKDFILAVDASDNGVNAYPADIEPKYSTSTGLWASVRRLNPAYYEENVSPDQRFYEAMKIAEDEFIWQVKAVVLSWLPVQNEVESLFKKRLEFHESGEIIILEKNCHWQDVLFDIEKKHDACGLIKFMLYQSGPSEWRVQAVPVKLKNYTNRKSLRKEWGGIVGDELVKVSGIDDIVFCHVNGFVGAARSLESAIRMATLSLVD